LLAQVALVLQYSPRGSGIPARLLLFLGLPLLMLVLARLAYPRLWTLALLVSAIVLVVDLGGFVSASSWLWHWPRPDDALRIVATPQPPVLPEPRVVVLPSMQMYGLYPQPLRYLTLLERRSAAFSSLMYGPDTPEAYFTSTAFRVENQDLSAWRIRGGSWQPDAWEATPPESARREPSSAPPGVTSAARLLRRPNRISTLRLAFDVPGDPVQLWVKVPILSSNAAPGAVEAELAFGATRVPRPYANSRRWETLTLAAGGQGHAVLTVRLNPGATDDVVIGSLT